MLLAASYAGVGFGNAGVHLPHGMSYPVSGQVKDYRAPGYPSDHPLVPHGISVILNAPAVFRFTAAANPARHLQAAEALGADVTGAKEADAGAILADRITWFMERLGVPNGLKAIGYTSADIPAPRRGNAAAAPRDEAVAATGRAGRIGRAVRGRDGRVVVRRNAVAEGNTRRRSAGSYIIGCDTARRDRCALLASFHVGTCWQWQVRSAASP